MLTAPVAAAPAAPSMAPPPPPPTFSTCGVISRISAGSVRTARMTRKMPAIWSISLEAFVTDHKAPA